MARWSILLLLALGLPAAPISAAPIVALAAELTRTGDAMLASVHTAGGFLTINHLSRPIGEDGLGCGWAPTGTDYSTVDAIEIVNGGGKRKTPGDLGAVIGSLATVIRAASRSRTVLSRTPPPISPSRYTTACEKGFVLMSAAPMGGSG